MSATELQEKVNQDPANWHARLELANALIENGEAADAARVISEAPAPPENEDDVIHAVHAAVGGDISVALNLVNQALENHSESAPLNVAKARLLCQENDAEGAAAHYRKAASIDSSSRDEELENWFENVAGMRIDVTDESGASVVEEGAPGDDVAPIEVGAISSLSSRRDGVEEPKPLKSVPAPNLTVTPETPVGAAAVVDGYAIDELHPAGVSAVAPAPGLHADDPGAAHAIHEQVLHDTGVSTAESFSLDDIKKMQGEHSQTKEKLSAMTVALVLHAAVFFVLGLIVIAVPRQAPPSIVAMATSSDEVSPEIEKKEVQKVTKPNPSSASRVNVLTSANTSSVAVPQVIEPIDTLEPIGAGNDFGMAMSFGAQGAGNVSFFGSKSKASKVVFVVDSSASMNSKGKTGISKHELMKQELSKTMKGLSSGVQFQIVFFSGPCWYVGDKVPNSRDQNDEWIEWEKGGKKLNFWHYGKDDDPEDLPVTKLRQATPGTIRKTIREIEETPATYGTDWRAPLKMAMNLEPDVIYFMTDGAVGKHPDKDRCVDDVLKYNRKKSNAKINTICLMVPKATEELRELADKTRGEFTLVLEDGTAIRGKELEDYEKGKK